MGATTSISMPMENILLFPSIVIIATSNIYLLGGNKKKSIRIRIEQQHCEDIKGYPLCNVSKILVKCLLLHPVAKGSTCEWGWGNVFFYGCDGKYFSSNSDSNSQGIVYFHTKSNNWRQIAIISHCGW